MSNERRPSNVVLSAVRKSVEARGDRSTQEMHTSGAEIITQQLYPLLDALSVPEESAYVPLRASTAIPYIRSSLMYAPKIKQGGKEYYLNVTAGAEMDGTKMG